MGGEEYWGETSLTPEDELRQRLRLRNDLSESIGIIASQPPHHLDDNGKLVWGEWNGGSFFGSNEVYRELETVMREAVEQELAKAVNLPPLDRTLPIHNYDHPPMAQSIPEIAAMIWEHGRPILENGLLVYEAGKLVRAVNTRVRRWFDSKNEEISRLNQPYYDGSKITPHGYVEANVTLTQGALIALVVAEIVDREGYQKDLAIDAQARGFAGYNFSGHPNSRLTYLLHVQYGGQKYGYVIESSGTVVEHFRILESKLVALPVPNLFTGETEEFDRRPAEDRLQLRTHAN